MNIPSREGKPRNIDLSTHWNPLRIFLLFFSFPVLQIICDSTNSFAFRNHTAKDPWKSIHPIELLHYFGCLILIGLFGQPPRKYAWNSRNGYLRDTPISKNRFEQITKYIHFRDRGPDVVVGESWWLKLGEVLTLLRQKCQKYWDIGSYLTVDEIMISFDGRSIQKVTIPAKPIPVGLKLQGLGDGGYMYSWEATRPKLAEFQQNTIKFSVAIPGIIPPVFAFLTATQSMVARLVESLPKEHQFHLYLDNLFVCWRLSQYLKGRGIALTGTCRKGACGYPPRLLALKGVPTSLNWGALQGTIVKGVFAWLWQDNNLVMGMFSSSLFLLFSISNYLYTRNDYRPRIY